MFFFFFVSQWIHWKRAKGCRQDYEWIGGDWPGAAWPAAEELAGFLQPFATLAVASWSIAAWAPPSPLHNIFVFHQTAGRCLPPSPQNSPVVRVKTSWLEFVEFTTEERCLLTVKQQLGTCSSCSSVSLSSSLCSKRSISDSSVVIGERIPPEVSERALGSSAESGELASPLPLDVDPPLFKPALKLQSRLALFPLTHGGKLGCTPLLRPFAGVELPSPWLTGPVEALRLPLVLWVGRLDMELRPESEKVPERQKEDILFY